MARGRYPFWTHDTVAAAVLAGVGMAEGFAVIDEPMWCAGLELR